MMSFLPSMAQTFAILSQEERQRQVKPHNNTILESTSLSTSATHNNIGPNNFKINYNPYKESSSNSNTSNTNTNNMPNLFCDFCKRSGHSKDICYKLHGYPPGQRFPKRRVSGFATNMHNFEEEKRHCEDMQISVNFSKDLYK